MLIFSGYKVVFFIGLLSLLAGCSVPQTQPDSGIRQTPELTAHEFIAEDGYRLPIVRYWPSGKREPKGLVLALHGFNDYSKAFEGMCEYFVQREMACIAYDQRGFGTTEMLGIWPEAGRLQKDLQVLIKQLHHQNPDIPIFLVGESMGGAVIMTAMSDETLSLEQYVSGVLLYAPAVWARSTQPWYQQLSLWLAVHTFPGWMPTGEGLGVQASDNIEALRAMGRDEKVIKATRIDTIYGLTNLMDAALLASKDISVKTMVLYGEKDEVIPKRPTCEMLLTMKHLEQNIVFIHYSEGYHMLTRDLQSERVFEDSLAWMFENVKFNEHSLNRMHTLAYCEEG